MRHLKPLRSCLFTLAAATGMLLALSVQAQSEYPTRPIKLIVPFPAGGTSDVMGRMIAEELGKSLKQPVVVENIGGAGGVIGTERGAKATPDGYTLIQTGVGQNAVAHGLNPKLNYDSNKDFIHLALDKLEAAAVKAMQSPAIKARMEGNGFVVPPQGSHEYTQFVARELDRWTRVIKVAGIKGE